MSNPVYVLIFQAGDCAAEYRGVYETFERAVREAGREPEDFARHEGSIFESGESWSTKGSVDWFEIYESEVQE